MLRNRISVRWAKSWQTPLPSRSASRPVVCTPVVPGTYDSSVCTQFAASMIGLLRVVVLGDPLANAGQCACWQG